jgi:hypothetical protein
MRRLLYWFWRIKLVANFAVLNAEVAALSVLVPQVQTGVKNLEATIEALKAAPEDPAIQAGIDAAATALRAGTDALTAVVATIPVVPPPGTP